jgi:dsRNA-specific ribonuclease
MKLRVCDSASGFVASSAAADAICGAAITDGGLKTAATNASRTLRTEIVRWTPQAQSANVAPALTQVLSSEEGAIMNYDSHQRAAEFHEMAAHAHRAAAVSHGKQDHFTGNEHSRQAMEHANKAHRATLEAFAQSAELAKAHSK